MHTNTDFLKSLRDNWMLLMFIGGMVVSWVRFENNIKAHEARLSDVEEKVVKVDAFNSDVRVDIAEIKVILEEMRRDIKQTP